MPYVEFCYHGESSLPIVATAVINETVSVGQIDMPDGIRYRAHCFLPGANNSTHTSKQDAVAALISAVNRWVDDAGLQDIEP